MSQAEKPNPTKKPLLLCRVAAVNQILFIKDGIQWRPSIASSFVRR